MTRLYRILALGLIGSAAACAVESVDEESVEHLENAVTSVAEAKVPFIRGDANGDGQLDVSDIQMVWAFAYAGGPIGCEDAADVNDDGTVDYEDGVALQSFLFYGGEEPAAPFPDAGLEPRYPSNDDWKCGDASLLCDSDSDCSDDHFCGDNGPNFGGLTTCMPDTFVRGDANDDGVVDHSDIQVTWGIAYSGTPAPCKDAADFNDDGAIDYRDGVAIQNFLYYGGDPPAAPYSEAGYDETEDGLGCRRDAD